jgi:hypothetical protein
MGKINRLNVAEHLLEYQFNLIGKTKMDAIMDETWIVGWSLTPEQYEQFRIYAVPLLKKVFKCNTNKAKQTFEWFMMQFGLQIL